MSKVFNYHNYRQATKQILITNKNKLIMKLPQLFPPGIQIMFDDSN